MTTTPVLTRTSKMTAKKPRPVGLVGEFVDSRAMCGCDAANEGRRAVGVDPAIKAANLRRLRRIEGQVRGLQKMVDEDRYCADIVTQVASVQEALRGVARQLMRNHLKHCATSAIKQGDVEAEAMYDELLDLVYKHLR